MSNIKVSELTEVTGLTDYSLFLVSDKIGGVYDSKSIGIASLRTAIDRSISFVSDGNTGVPHTENIRIVNGPVIDTTFAPHTATFDFSNYATTGSNTFIGAQGISGSLSISGLTAGSFGDSAMVINPSTHVVGTMPQGLRTTYGLFSQTGTSITVSGTTTETTIVDGGVGTLSVPANGFSIGDAFRADLAGELSSANNETIRIRVKTGNTILLDTGAQTISPAVTNNVWTLSINFNIRNIGVAGVADIVSIGRFTYAKTVNGTVEGFSFNTVNNTTFDTTITNTLDITVQFGSTSASNRINTDIFTLNKIY